MNTINLNGNQEIESLKTTPRIEPGTEATIHQEPGTEVSNSVSAADVITVSDQATAIRLLVEKVAQLPEIRTDRIESLRTQINNNEYNPDPARMADALLKSEP